MADTETVKQDNATESVNAQERTFTQDEVNAIVKGRLEKESAKFADYEELQKKASKLDEIEEANKTELQKATEKADALQKQIDEMTKATELRDIREKVSTETGVPMSLLSADNEEDCKAQAEAILNFANANKTVNYPTVKDGGEVTNFETKKSVQDQFADWFKASTSN